MLTSWSEQLTPATLSIASVLIRPPLCSGPPLSAYSIRARCVKPEVAALADDPAAQLARVHPDRVVGLVADVGVGLGRRLDVGADAAVAQQVDGRLEDRLDQLVGGELLGLDARAPPRPAGESLIDLAARE